MNNRLENIGNNIRYIRKRQQLSQIDLAVMVGIDRAYLSEIENGKTNTSISILYAIADALNTQITQLFSDSEQLPPSKTARKEPNRNQC